MSKINLLNVGIIFVLFFQQAFAAVQLPCATNMAAREHGSRRVVLRERNIRGFALFLQNLKSVLNLLASEQVLTAEILSESRHRLLDASGTLTFLISDITNGVGNATGISSVVLQDPVQNLKHSLTQPFALLASLIESYDNADFYDALDISYSAPMHLSQTGRDRRRYEITKEQLEHLRSLYFS